ncbi:hypothetical protein SS50377_24646 [Spironucleus salmonicida]|uniref:Uncharacterized protein n=1 Tax=Spironucleus salmonicida TaxID=348837 RepID=V6LIS3_9EUKA|nr:hypothetical protein SS50377_24646 [Spironucleus salmonicida]|eukprot:EST44505.1 Hypothetical protein SS50377_15502 [Spironucleus salmonicida]
MFLSDRPRTSEQVYSYGASGHKPMKMSSNQQSVLNQYGHLMSKENKDIIMIPAYEMAKNGFGSCKHSNNEFCINNATSTKGRNYMRQKPRVNSYSLFCETYIPK